jgi:hypothetical protein
MTSPGVIETEMCWSVGACGTANSSRPDSGSVDQLDFAVFSNELNVRAGCQDVLAQAIGLPVRAFNQKEKRSRQRPKYTSRRNLSANALGAIQHMTLILILERPERFLRRAFLVHSSQRAA